MSTDAGHNLALGRAVVQHPEYRHAENSADSARVKISVMNTLGQSIGTLLREWRQRRRLTQLELAAQANISTRHLSFLETGRAKPSRDLLLRFVETLQIPMRDRNALFHSAGFALPYAERPLVDPALTIARQAIDVILKAHEPLPAFAVDRHWTLVASNSGLRPYLGDIEPSLLVPPVNVLRLTLHPQGLAPRLGNYRQWRAHVLTKLRGQLNVSGDPTVSALLEELQNYPDPAPTGENGAGFVAEDWHHLVVPFQLITPGGLLSFYSTTTIFGTPLDVALSEISLECFYPADRATAEAFRLPPDAALPVR